MPVFLKSLKMRTLLSELTEPDKAWFFNKRSIQKSTIEIQVIVLFVFIWLEFLSE